MTQGRFIDQMGREVQIPNTPVKIVSLVPSITELLHFLGFDKEVVGITKFCIHPKKWQETKQRIGGTKNLNIQNIIALEPDIVIGNKEENTREDISALEKKVPIWMSEINSFNDALGFINCMGLVL
jgi:ABC-type Fe3+-hydroxamate transport system substrate-binding protein